MTVTANPDSPADQANASLRACFAAIARAAAGHPEPDVVAAKARGVMTGYHARWATEGWKASLVGPVFHLPIVNPATGYPSRTFTQAGRCDAVVVRRGRPLLLESKTAGEDVSLVDGPFWRRLAVDTQTETYVLARRQQGEPVAGILCDVLRRPQIRPRVIPKGTPKATDRENVGTRLELQKQKTYFGWPVDPAEREAVFQGDGRETSELYSMRIAADTLERPGWYFQRRVLERSDAQLARQRQELWETAVEIRLAWRAGRHYRNSDACTAYNRPCPYLPICSGRDKPDSGRWQPLESIHPELAAELGEIDQRSVLTHTRMQCFKLCHRRHYYRYELGIVPAEQAASDTLRFSRLIRRALAAWWATIDPSR